MQVPKCNLQIYGSCNAEATWAAIAVLFLLVALLIGLVWIHNHNNHKPWKMKCGWVKIDGLWHFFSRKVTPEEPCIFGGTSCNGMKCAKGMKQSEHKIDFVEHWKQKKLDNGVQKDYNNTSTQ